MIELYPGNKLFSDRKFKVSEISTLIKTSLEHDFKNITIEGEISNFRPSSTGHLYFSLKDNDAMISAVMFKNRFGSLKFKPADGMLVKATGNITVYMKRGNYQIVCEQMTRAGQGDILARLEERKQKLAALGFFDPAHKKPLPPCPSKIAVVTSPTGAAIQDILRVLGRRNAGLNMVILPAPVQGAIAPQVIAEQIHVANVHKLGEVIIVGRGGGSLEDLLPFYDDLVVRAIYDSEIPVISAVGHEIDTSFADLAADVRAATPSAAAEMVSVSTDDIVRRVEDMKSAMIASISRQLQNVRTMASHFRIENIERNFRTFIQPRQMRLDEAKDHLITRMNGTLKDARHRLELVTKRLESNSPFEILKRGYAVVTMDKAGETLYSSESVEVGDALNIQLYEGRVKAAVTEKMLPVKPEESHKESEETPGEESQNEEMNEEV